MVTLSSEKRHLDYHRRDNLNIYPTTVHFIDNLYIFSFILKNMVDNLNAFFVLGYQVFCTDSLARKKYR
jgi:hypothetical protein